MIEWKAVRDNNLTIEQLQSFSGGVAVEFLNNDFFNEANNKLPIFNELKNRLGSDEIVSSIISIHSEAGSSSSELQRKSFKKLIDNTAVNCKGKKIVITENNYKNYSIKQIKDGKLGIGCGNEWWSGFLFVSIRGGQQDTIETHHGEELTIFNPACEFATKEVCMDIDLVMIYFAFLSINSKNLDNANKDLYETLLNQIKEALESSYYDSEAYKGNLLEYCENHISTTLQKGVLTDPIQLKEIAIDNFNIEKRVADSIDFTHDEAVYHQKYYWDKEKRCILTPARPTNVFWSFHLSNMMQQDYSLIEYFKYEEERFKRRQVLLNHRQI